MNASVKLLVCLILLTGSATALAQDVPAVGDIVYAQWRPNDWYHGKVVKKNDDGFHILFDDGDRAVVGGRKVALDRAPDKGQVKIGTRVVAKWKGDNRFYPGRIDQINADGRYKIAFEDGDSGFVRIGGIRIIARQ